LGYWVCEHRHLALANMIGFRATTHGEAVTDWETINPDHIAFGRGAKGFVAINNGGGSAVYTYQTSLPAGNYCDIITGNLTPDGLACTGGMVVVDGNGHFTATVAIQEALAIQVSARTGLPSLAIEDGSVLEGTGVTRTLRLTVTL
jgi:alpha-amylase